MRPQYGQDLSMMYLNHVSIMDTMERAAISDGSALECLLWIF